MTMRPAVSSSRMERSDKITAGAYRATVRQSPDKTEPPNRTEPRGSVPGCPLRDLLRRPPRDSTSNVRRARRVVKGISAAIVPRGVPQGRRPGARCNYPNHLDTRRNPQGARNVKETAHESANG